MFDSELVELHFKNRLKELLAEVSLVFLQTFTWMLLICCVELLPSLHIRASVWRYPNFGTGTIAITFVAFFFDTAFVTLWDFFLLKKIHKNTGLLTPLMCVFFVTHYSLQITLTQCNLIKEQRR